MKITKLLDLCFSPSLTLLKKTSKTYLFIPFLKVIMEAIKPSHLLISTTF